MKRILYVMVAMLVISYTDGVADDITTLLGKKYENIKVQQAEALSLRIIHSCGGATIPWSELSEEDRVRYGYDSDREAFELKARADGDQLGPYTPENRINLVGRVFQVLDGGVLVEGGVTREVNNVKVSTRTVGKKQSYNRTGHSVYGGQGQSTIETVEPYVSTEFSPVDGVFFIYCNTCRLVDGSPIKTSAYPKGTYQYTSVNGALRTVRAFSVHTDNFGW